MKKISLANELATNTYPGRGIIIGRSDDGKHAVAAYFIMGRSVNSRNRVFVRMEKAYVRKPLTRQSLAIRV